jgi:uroporphyrinogen decarboxylase
MTSRELVVKTLNHEPVPRVARDLWLGAGEDWIRADELAEINVRYPSDIVQPEVPPAHGKRSQGKPSKAGDYTDAWGCVWHVDQRGAPPELKLSPLTDAGKIAEYQPPTELLDRSRFAKVNKSCQATNRFVLAWSEVRPFDRLRHLRGSEAAPVDLARDTKETRSLLAMLHDFGSKEIELWAETDVDGVVLGDDWGTPEGLLIAPEMWREIFRPLYREYCKLLHAKDKFVFFRSDGNILDILGDLVKMGVDAIHCQMHLMDVERLAKRFHGRVTFWGEMDPQWLRDPGSPEKFREAVLAVRRALDFGGGGVIAQCQWAPGVRLRTIAAFFEQWLVPLPMHA